MCIEGKLIKSGKWWAVEIPLLLIFTQGRSKKDAFAMAKDAVECLFDDSDVRVAVSDCGNKTFCISSSNEQALMSLALRQQRASHNLTIRDVAARLGSKSPTAYSRYEQGKTKPSLDKFSQLLKAIDPRLDPIITVV
jgi:predicted transcriptional regulator|tara:strand:+ start:276 stop:686 length:411 start_codon:yes stop_codon:yes gene_type:complete